MNFCSRYLNDVETKSNRRPRNDDRNIAIGHVLGRGERCTLDHVTWVQVHRYVLVNTDVVVPYRE